MVAEVNLDRLWSARKLNITTLERSLTRDLLKESDLSTQFLNPFVTVTIFSWMTGVELHIIKLKLNPSNKKILIECDNFI